MLLKSFVFLAVFLALSSPVTADGFCKTVIVNITGSGICTGMQINQKMCLPAVNNGNATAATIFGSFVTANCSGAATNFPLGCTVAQGTFKDTFCSLAGGYCNAVLNQMGTCAEDNECDDLGQLKKLPCCSTVEQSLPMFCTSPKATGAFVTVTRSNSRCNDVAPCPASVADKTTAAPGGAVGGTTKAATTTITTPAPSTASGFGANMVFALSAVIMSCMVFFESQ